MPGDQRVDDAFSAVWQSEPLAQCRDIVGAPVVRLVLACDRAQGQVAVRLNHVHPDGASTRITYGVLNLSHRNGPEVPEAMVPGRAEEITLCLIILRIGCRRGGIASPCPCQTPIGR